MNTYRTLFILNILCSTSLYCMYPLARNEKVEAISSLYNMSHTFLTQYEADKKMLVNCKTIHSLRTLIEKFITETKTHDIKIETLIDYASVKQCNNNILITPAHVALLFQKLNDHKQDYPQKKDLTEFLQNQTLNVYIEQIYYSYQLESEAKKLNLPITFTHIITQFPLLQEHLCTNTNIISFIKFYMCIQKLINLEPESAEFFANACSTANRQTTEKK